MIRRRLLRLLNHLARRHALHIERVDDMLARAGRRVRDQGAAFDGEHRGPDGEWCQ